MALSDFEGFFYKGLNIVSRELVGFIPASSRDAELNRMAIGTPITFSVSQPRAAEDITPSLVPTGGSALAPEPGTVTLQKQRRVKFNWNGNDAVKMMNSGTYDTISGDAFTQAIRTLVNEIEVDLMRLYSKTSRAYGTVGTIPFGTADELSDSAQMLKILKDNGSPLTGLRLPLDTTTSTNMLSKQSNLFKVNEAGSSDMLRDASLGVLQKWQIGETGAEVTHTKGTGTLLQTDLGSTLPVGSTVIHLDTGTGTVVAGDVVTFAGDTNKYIVKTGADATGPVDIDIEIQAPGLRQTLADGVAMTIGDNYSVAGIGVAPGSMLLGLRLPPLPDEGDAAIDEMLIQDPHSGIPFRVAVYAGDHMNQYSVETAWGVNMINNAHTALLIR